jgi:hypothetical protein
MKEVAMNTRLILAPLLCAASLGWAAAAEPPARPPVVRNVQHTLLEADATVEETAGRARAGKPVRPAVEPALKQSREFERPGRDGPDDGVTNLPVPYQPERATDEPAVSSPGPAASVDLAPDEAEARCLRSEGQMRCTPLHK